jgi:HPt (histidine-containing phosphotransfer) domain-containing protein
MMISLRSNIYYVAVSRTGGAFVDFDTIPEDAAQPIEIIRFLLSEKSKSIRNLLIDEAINAGDILLRQLVRKSFTQISARLPRPPRLFSFVPPPEKAKLPYLVPIRTADGRIQFSTVISTATDIVEIATPKLSRDEELYAISLKDLTRNILGEDFSLLLNGDVLQNPSAAVRVLLTLAQNAPQLSKTAVARIAKRIEQNSLAISRPYGRVSNLSYEGNQYNSDLANVVDSLKTLSSDELQALRNLITTVLLRISDRVEKRLKDLPNKFI